MQAEAFDPHAPLGTRRAVIRHASDGIEMVELGWGLKPRDEDGRPFRFVRAEGRRFPTHRCLIPASEFQVTRAGRHYRVAMADRNWFYLAGIWQPSRGSWPEAYAVLTVQANAEVARYQTRQGAVVRRADRMQWLDLSCPEDELLQPLEPGSFRIECCRLARSSRCSRSEANMLREPSGTSLILYRREEERPDGG